MIIYYFIKTGYTVGELMSLFLTYAFVLYNRDCHMKKCNLPLHRGKREKSFEPWHKRLYEPTQHLHHQHAKLVIKAYSAFSSTCEVPIRRMT